ncbi:ABC transporter substrate-binding protein [Limobrevibacterium gyesilva]|uniref:Thiamine pyrimidine synthase n=1 Tax=Limobrevibacterium gyesilva TaxID=2991712 RepID=A0AA41YLI8_9PROT|nr:ABC transporter substrate-binding protein [Limobrevibacterium gyesilva]MCW3476084.1 ABC transporter substrate-binding protein [Limobrevibacterium gyesilva]
MPTTGHERTQFGRRVLLKAGAALAGGAAISFSDTAAAATTTVNMQLGWLGGGNQIGEAVAQQLGYFEQEGLDCKIQAGGPNNDGIAIVASGRYELGQVSSSPSLMLAASQDIPIRCFAVSAQQHPYAFFSLKKNPVRTPADFRGKKVGIQATGAVLLRALLAKNNIDQKDVQIVIIGSEMTPLMTGQVDVVTGWLTNTTALKVIGADRVDLKLWDAGVRLYANPYYATTDTLTQRKDLLVRFLRAAGRGWAYTYANRDKAVELLIKQFPNLVAKDEREAVDVMLAHCFNANTMANGYGAMDPAIWQDQIALYSQLGQFAKRTPKVDEVMTLDILNATADVRPRIG